MRCCELFRGHRRDSTSVAPEPDTSILTPGGAVMSFYLSNSDIAPTGAEPVEFLDDPDLLGQADVCELPARPPVAEAEQTADPEP